MTLNKPILNDEKGAIDRGWAVNKKERGTWGQWSLIKMASLFGKLNGGHCGLAEAGVQLLLAGPDASHAEPHRRLRDQRRENDVQELGGRAEHNQHCPLT